MHPGGSPSDNGRSTPVPGANAALALLLAINLFNYIDRQVLSAVLPKMQLDAALFNPADPWLQTKAGALTTAFMASYMLLSPVFGRLGDRLSRWLIVGLAVTVWSVASGCSGFAATYWILLATRALVGVGEAAYGPIAPAMLSDMYPTRMRGSIMSYFYLAIPVGSALGFVIGGQLEEWSGDWRTAFHFTFFGVLLGLLCLFMKEPPRSAPAPAAGEPAGSPAGNGQSYFGVLKSLTRNKSFVYCCTGMTCTTFVLGGVAVFVPTYIFQRDARFEMNDRSLRKLEALEDTAGRPVVAPEVVAKLRAGLSDDERTYADMRTLLAETLSEDELYQYGQRVYEAATAEGSVTNGKVTFLFGVITVVMGLAATLLGGIVGERLRERGVRGAYFKVAGWGTIVGWPLFLGFLFAPNPWSSVFLGGAIFFLFFNTGPANTIIANVVSGDIRATAFAVNILVIHALGDAISPTLIGLVADHSDLHTAFVGVSVMILVGGGLWVAGARHLDEDTARAVAGERGA